MNKNWQNKNWQQELPDSTQCFLGGLQLLTINFFHRFCIGIDNYGYAAAPLQIEFHEELKKNLILPYPIREHYKKNINELQNVVLGDLFTPSLIENSNIEVEENITSSQAYSTYLQKLKAGFLYQIKILLVEHYSHCFITIENLIGLEEFNKQIVCFGNLILANEGRQKFLPWYKELFEKFNQKSFSSILIPIAEDIVKAIGNIFPEDFAKFYSFYKPEELLVIFLAKIFQKILESDNFDPSNPKSNEIINFYKEEFEKFKNFKDSYADEIKLEYKEIEHKNIKFKQAVLKENFENPKTDDLMAKKVPANQYLEQYINYYDSLINGVRDLFENQIEKYFLNLKIGTKLLINNFNSMNIYEPSYGINILHLDEQTSLSFFTYLEKLLKIKDQHSKINFGLKHQVLTDFYQILAVFFNKAWELRNKTQKDERLKFSHEISEIILIISKLLDNIAYLDLDTHINPSVIQTIKIFVQDINKLLTKAIVINKEEVKILNSGDFISIFTNLIKYLILKFESVLSIPEKELIDLNIPIDNFDDFLEKFQNIFGKLNDNISFLVKAALYSPQPETLKDYCKKILMREIGLINLDEISKCDSDQKKILLCKGKFEKLESIVAKLTLQYGEKFQFEELPAAYQDILDTLTSLKPNLPVTPIQPIALGIVKILIKFYICLLSDEELPANVSTLKELRRLTLKQEQLAKLQQELAAQNDYDDCKENIAKILTDSINSYEGTKNESIAKLFSPFKEILENKDSLSIPENEEKIRNQFEEIEDLFNKLKNLSDFISKKHKANQEFLKNYKDQLNRILNTKKQIREHEKLTTQAYSKINTVNHQLGIENYVKHFNESELSLTEVQNLNDKLIEIKKIASSELELLSKNSIFSQYASQLSNSLNSLDTCIKALKNTYDQLQKSKELYTIIQNWISIYQTTKPPKKYGQEYLIYVQKLIGNYEQLIAQMQSYQFAQSSLYIYNELRQILEKYHKDFESIVLQFKQQLEQQQKVLQEKQAPVSIDKIKKLLESIVDEAKKPRKFISETTDKTSQFVAQIDQNLDELVKSIEGILQIAKDAKNLKPGDLVEPQNSLAIEKFPSQEQYTLESPERSKAPQGPLDTLMTFYPAFPDALRERLQHDSWTKSLSQTLAHAQPNALEGLLQATQKETQQALESPPKASDVLPRFLRVGLINLLLTQSTLDSQTSSCLDACRTELPKPTRGYFKTQEVKALLKYLPQVLTEFQRTQILTPQGLAQLEALAYPNAEIEPLFELLNAYFELKACEQDRARVQGQNQEPQFFQNAFPKELKDPAQILLKGAAPWAQLLSALQQASLQPFLAGIRTAPDPEALRPSLIHTLKTLIHLCFFPEDQALQSLLRPFLTSKEPLERLVLQLIERLSTQTPEIRQRLAPLQQALEAAAQVLGRPKELQAKEVLEEVKAAEKVEKEVKKPKISQEKEGSQGPKGPTQVDPMKYRRETYSAQELLPKAQNQPPYSEKLFKDMCDGIRERREKFEEEPPQEFPQVQNKPSSYQKPYKNLKNKNSKQEFFPSSQQHQKQYSQSKPQNEGYIYYKKKTPAPENNTEEPYSRKSNQYPQNRK